MDSLALSNDYTTLLKEAERLRADLSSKIIERDNLVLIECKNLSVIYYTTIGIYEYKVFEKYCAIQRIKRKIELIQMYLNRDEAVYIPAVEAQLDKEYAEYAQRLDDFLNDINTADDLSKCGFLSPEETAELKKQYRGIVKRLHPDLNPNVTEQQLELFHKAVPIYKKSAATRPELLGGLYNNMGLTLAALGRYSESEESYKKALAVMGKTPGGELEEAMTLLNLANLVEAESGLESGESRIFALLDEAWEKLDGEKAPRDWYYAFVCEKCAPTFEYYGYFLASAELNRRSEEIYERA